MKKKTRSAAKEGVAGIVLQGDDEGAIPRAPGKKPRGRRESALSLRDEEGMVGKRPSRKQPVEESLSLRDDEGSTIKRTSKRGKPGPVKITLQPEPEAAPVPKTLEDLGVSARVRKCLEQTGIRTVSRLTKKKPADLLTIDGLGKNALGEIREKLRVHGMSLRTDPWGFTPHGDVEALTLQAGNERNAGGRLRGDDEGPPRRQARKRKK